MIEHDKEKLVDWNGLDLPKHKRLQLTLEEKIRAGEWKAGQRLPTEVDLMDQYGLSSATVGRAMRELAKAGLIQRQRRSGTFVSDNPSNFSLPDSSPKRASNLAFFHDWPVNGFHPYFTELTNGLVQAAGQHGLGLQLHHIASATTLDINAAFRSHVGVAGLVTLDIEKHQAENALRHHVPLVLLSEYWQDLAIDRVVRDESELYRTAFRHFRECGHQAVALVDHHARTNPQEYAAEAFACRPNTKPLAEIYTYDYGERGAGEAFDKLRSLRPRPTAVFVGDDFLLLHLLRRFEREGIAIPGELAVIGRGTTRSKDILGTGISMMEMDAQAMGMAAVDLLLEQLHQGRKPGRTVTMPYTLALRDSS